MAKLINVVGSKMPSPVMTAINAAYRVREKGFGHGYGRIHMYNPIRVGARHLMEVLAGRRSVDDFNASFGLAKTTEVEKSKMISPFELALKEGRLPIRISVSGPDEQEADNVVEIEFGPPDPAISKFH